MARLKHSKKRNVGLVYEFLIREVSNATVAGDHSRAARALQIIEGHLTEGTLLHEELSLHRQVIESRGVSERLARRIIDELKAAGLRFSTKAVLRERAKSDLIHEMNRVLGRDIFDRYRIPDYTAHASVNILLSRGLGSRIDEGVEMARVEEHLMAFLGTVATAPQYDPDATVYAYKNAVGLFETEFGKELTGEQSSLLREYIRVSLGGNPEPFRRAFERQRRDLREVLRARKADEVFTSDPQMAQRLDEALLDLEGLTVSATDESVERLMLYHNLRREIES